MFRLDTTHSLVKGVGTLLLVYSRKLDLEVLVALFDYVPPTLWACNVS